MLLLSFYQAASSSTETVDSVMLYITVISLILLLGVTAVMIYFVFKYHRKKGHKPKDIHGNIWLEIIWIGIPTILVLTMFYYGYTGFKDIRNIPDDAFEVEVIARMWEWEFNYKNGKKTDTLYVPVNKYVKLTMESRDVNHSLYIPSFRIKEDVIAGKKNYLAFKADNPGTYVITCAEYCGLKHSDMYSAVVALPEKAFTAWYGEDPDKIDSSALAKVIDHPGVRVLKEKGCVGCHSLDGTKNKATSFANMLGTTTTVLTYGVEQEIERDKNYLKKALIKPHRNISLKSESEVFPENEVNLSSSEIDQIVDALSKLQVEISGNEQTNKSVDVNNTQIADTTN